MVLGINRTFQALGQYALIQLLERLYKGEFNIAFTKLRCPHFQSI